MFKISLLLDGSQKEKIYKGLITIKTMATMQNEDTMLVEAIQEAVRTLKELEERGHHTSYFEACERYKTVIIAHGLRVNSFLYGKGKRMLGREDREDIFSPEPSLVDIL